MSLNTGQPKVYDFESSKFTTEPLPFPVQNWGGEASGVPGATNLPSLPVAPLSIPVHDPSNVTTLVPYSGAAAADVIDGIDLKPLALPGTSFDKVGLGKGSHTPEQFDAKKFTDDRPFGG